MLRNAAALCVFASLRLCARVLQPRRFLYSFAAIPSRLVPSSTAVVGSGIGFGFGRTVILQLATPSWFAGMNTSPCETVNSPVNVTVEGPPKNPLVLYVKMGITPVLSPGARVTGPPLKGLTNAKNGSAKSNTINVPSNSPTTVLRLINAPESVTGEALTFVRLPLNVPVFPATNV